MEKKMVLVAEIKMSSTKRVVIPIDEIPPSLSFSKIDREGISELSKFCDKYSEETNQNWKKDPHQYRYTIEEVAE